MPGGILDLPRRLSKRLADILLDELEARVCFQMLDVFGSSRDQIIQRNYLMPFPN